MRSKDLSVGAVCSPSLPEPTPRNPSGPEVEVSRTRRRARGLVLARVNDPLSKAGRVASAWTTGAIFTNWAERRLRGHFHALHAT